jgi:hypothetical protein
VITPGPRVVAAAFDKRDTPYTNDDLASIPNSNLTLLYVFLNLAYFGCSFN